MQLHWHTEPLLILAILCPLWLYLLGTIPFRSHFTQQGFPWFKSFLFTSAVVIVYLSVGSPLDEIAEKYLFYMHMVQHMLLIYVVPFLLYWGTPSWLIDGVLQRLPTLKKTLHLLTRPICGGMLFTFSYTVWHIPVLYEAALHDKTIHILEHAIMFSTGALMLWPIASPSKEIPASAYGVRMLYTFVLMIGQLPVFAFLSFADEVLYPTYELAPRLWGISPMQDQILGGVVMKVSNMIVSLSILIYSFYRWYQNSK